MISKEERIINKFGSQMRPGWLGRQKFESPIFETKNMFVWQSKVLIQISKEPRICFVLLFQNPASEVRNPWGIDAPQVPKHPEVSLRLRCAFGKLPGGTQLHWSWRHLLHSVAWHSDAQGFWPDLLEQTGWFEDRNGYQYMIVSVWFAPLTDSWSRKESLINCWSTTINCRWALPSSSWNCTHSSFFWSKNVHQIEAKSPETLVVFLSLVPAELGAVTIKIISFIRHWPFLGRASIPLNCGPQGIVGLRIPMAFCDAVGHLQPPGPFWGTPWSRCFLSERMTSSRMWIQGNMERLGGSCAAAAMERFGKLAVASILGCWGWKLLASVSVLLPFRSGFVAWSRW